MQLQKLTISLCTSHALKSTRQLLFFVSGFVRSERKARQVLLTALAELISSAVELLDALDAYGKVSSYAQFRWRDKALYTVRYRHMYNLGDVVMTQWQFGGREVRDEEVKSPHSLQCEWVVACDYPRPVPYLGSTHCHLDSPGRAQEGLDKWVIAPALANAKQLLANLSYRYIHYPPSSMIWPMSHMMHTYPVETKWCWKWSL